MTYQLCLLWIMFIYNKFTSASHFGRKPCLNWLQLGTFVACHPHVLSLPQLLTVKQTQNAQKGQSQHWLEAAHPYLHGYSYQLGKASNWPRPPDPPTAPKSLVHCMSVGFGNLINRLIWLIILHPFNFLLCWNVTLRTQWTLQITSSVWYYISFTTY